MNRRQFIEDGMGALTALLLFPTDLFRYATGQPPRETPVTLGNRSVFATLWGNWGIRSGDVEARAAELNKRPSLVFDPYAVTGDGWNLEPAQRLGDPTSMQFNKAGDLTALINQTVANLNDDQGAEVCMDNLAMELHKLDCYPGYYPVGIDDGGVTMRRMNRLLAANPETTREQAFFEAVMEGAEGT